MSNAIVGGVYQTIIDDVINSSRVDFEESGVDEAVLEELRKVSRALLLCHLDGASVVLGQMGNQTTKSTFLPHPYTSMVVGKLDGIDERRCVDQKSVA